MISLIIYLLVLLAELLFFASFAVFACFLIYSSIKGSPYVPTKTKEIFFILKKARLKKNQVFLDLGCGDGRVVREAVKKYQVRGIGLEINIILIWWARLLAKIQKLSSIKFMLIDIVNKKLPRADVIYIFLLPKLIEKITPKLKNQLERGTLIISHGFKITGLSKFFYKKIDHHPFPTYYYNKNNLRGFGKGSPPENLGGLKGIIIHKYSEKKYFSTD